MSENDHDDFLASMYQSEDEEDRAAIGVDIPTKPVLMHPSHAMNMVQMSAYVRKLEKTVEEQGRALRRVENDMRRLIHTLNSTRRTFASELEQKIDRRDF